MINIHIYYLHLKFNHKVYGEKLYSRIVSCSNKNIKLQTLTCNLCKVVNCNICKVFFRLCDSTKIFESLSNAC